MFDITHALDHSFTVLGEQHIATVIGHKFYMLYSWGHYHPQKRDTVTMNIHDISHKGYTVLEWYGWNYHPRTNMRIDVDSVITREFRCTWEEWEKYKTDPLIMLTLGSL